MSAVIVENVVGKALNELYRMFDKINMDKFEGSLPRPVITLMSGRGTTLGHFTVDKVWKRIPEAEVNEDDEVVSEESYYEINVDPRWFAMRGAIDICETLMHEMCHYFNKLSDIKDCSGNMHNKKFKEAAERIGLEVERGKSVGWGYTKLGEELYLYVHDEVKPSDEAFEYFKSVPVKENTGKKRKKSLFKYTCPECGQVVKGKRDIRILCGECNVELVMEDVSDEDEGTDEA